MRAKWENVGIITLIVGFGIYPMCELSHVIVILWWLTCQVVVLVFRIMTRSGLSVTTVFLDGRNKEVRKTLVVGP